MIRLNIVVLWRPASCYPCIIPMNCHGFRIIIFLFRPNNTYYSVSSLKWWHPHEDYVNIVHKKGVVILNPNANCASSNRTASRNVKWSVWPISQRKNTIAFHFICQVSWYYNPFINIKCSRNVRLCMIVGNERTKVCRMTEIEQFALIELKYSNNLTVNLCNCLADCTSISYDVEFSQVPFYHSESDKVLTAQRIHFGWAN